MNTLKFRPVGAATAILFAVQVLSLLLLVTCGKKQDAPSQDVADFDFGTASPRDKSPVLTIGGQEDTSVYLQSLDIRVEVTGNIASTRHTMVFKNRTNRILEGMLTFPLTDGRTVTHYALDINGKMREAVPVEKARGTTVFEEIKRRRVDPGLLERVEGNNFRTRVYPVPVNGTRTISIGYEEELPLEKGELRYNLPMAYANPIEKFSVRITVWKNEQTPVAPETEEGLRFDTVGENYVAAFAHENYRPARALNFSLPAPADIPRVLTQSAQGSRYFLASVAPAMEARKKRWGDTLAIVWDVSLSGTQRDLRKEKEVLNIIFAEKKNAVVHLYYLNNRFKKIVDKKVIHMNGGFNVTDGKWDRLKNTLNAAIFDGGTDFSQININDIIGDEILFFSDGISTLSDADFLTIPQTMESRPIHCVVSSAKTDYSAMKSIAGKTKGKFININSLSYRQLKDELSNETPLFLGAERGKSVREVYPGIATPFLGSFSAAGISDTGDAELTLLFGFGDKVEKRIKVNLDAKSAGNQANVYKIWAQKKITELDLGYEKNETELTELGKQFGIVTRNTSLIVLETLGDYMRYGVPPPPDLQKEYQSEIRNGRGKDVSGVERFGGPSTGRFPAPDYVSGFDGMAAGAESQAPGEKGAQTSTRQGQDNGGGANAKKLIPATPGVGSNKCGGDPRARVTKMGVLGILSGRYANARKTEDLPEEVDDLLASVGGQSERIVTMPGFQTGERGSLAGGRTREGVQHVFERNMPGIRYRYNRRLREKPGLKGEFTLNFAIDEFGRVIYAQTEASTMNDTALENNIANLIKMWYFEKIDKPGDVTEVKCPLFFNGEAVPPRKAKKAKTAPKTAEARENDPAMLAMAVNAANTLREWWNNYPAPDEKKTGPDGSTAYKYGGYGGDNVAYMKKLTGKTAKDYQLYLKLRADYINSPEFYFDMAEWFYAHDDKETALRVLTSVAELNLENASLYRLLGYRLKEYVEYGPEKFVCRKVATWRPMEPQSHRDYALALADNGEAQAALDSLCSLLTKDYTGNIIDRNSRFHEVLVTDINHLIAENPGIDTSKVDGRLTADLSVDIRVIINWNPNNTDIKLRVTDPRGEECFTRNRTTQIGGRISGDITTGHGPEQFMLKNAVKGSYRIYAGYYGNSQVTADGPSAVMVEIYAYAGGGKEDKRWVICKRLPAKGEPAGRTSGKNRAKDNGEKVAVAEFKL
ncbi:MAG: AgmX/PglI C-terminal domain-containing protein [Chitinispirillales bacterium]|jgi:hypothetical protein|nr:AgmX/PglI C-terminal domain-containing protein [Chitinispirillales bacterium]